MNVTAYDNLSQTFSVNACKEALADILLAFKLPENASRLEEAQNNAGNDMLKSMQLFFPVATEIEMDIIEKYGFTKDGDGLIRFTQAVKAYSVHNSDIAAMSANLKSILIPGITAFDMARDTDT